MNKENIESPFGKFAQDNSISLTINDGPSIIMDKRGFWFNGEKIEDTGEVYHLFKEWLLLAHKADFGNFPK